MSDTGWAKAAWSSLFAPWLGKEDYALTTLALAWMLHRHPHVLPIPGTRRSQHLQQNLAAAQATLPAEVMDALDALFAPGRVAGARYTEAGWVGIEASATA